MTPVVNLLPASTTPAAHIELRIFLQNLQKFYSSDKRGEGIKKTCSQKSKDTVHLTLGEQIRHFFSLSLILLGSNLSSPEGGYCTSHFPINVYSQQEIKAQLCVLNNSHTIPVFKVIVA